MKTLNDFESWEGLDVDLETSLFEYGLLFNPNAKENECDIFYGISTDRNGEYNGFAYSSVDWKELSEKTWIDWDAVESFCGGKMPESFDLNYLSALVMYYGHDDIFGTCYETPILVEKPQ